MGIPINIAKVHIIEAIREIDRDGVLPKRKSTGYDLVYEGKYYPPKYVVSIANRYANGKEFSSYEFGGGKETNDFLKERGFQIIEK